MSENEDKSSINNAERVKYFTRLKLNEKDKNLSQKLKIQPLKLIYTLMQLLATNVPQN